MDNMNVHVNGVFLGVNSHKGVGENHARIFIRRDDYSQIDGLVPIRIYKELVRGQSYNLHLTKANDPHLSRRGYK